MGQTHSGRANSHASAYSDRHDYYKSHVRHNSRLAERSQSEMVLNNNSHTRIRSGSTGSVPNPPSAHIVPVMGPMVMTSSNAPNANRPQLQRAISTMNASMTRPDMRAPRVQKVMKPIELVQMLQGMGFSAQAIEESMAALRLQGRRTVIDANALIESLLLTDTNYVDPNQPARKAAVPFHDSGVGDGPQQRLETIVESPLTAQPNLNMNPTPAAPSARLPPLPPAPYQQQALVQAQAQPQVQAIRAEALVAPRSPASQAEMDSIQRYLDSLVSQVDREVEHISNGPRHTDPSQILSPTGKKRSQSVSSMESTDRTCRICMDAPIQTVILRCGHLALCVECSKGLEKCPICRNEITEIVRIYQA